jgi:glycosyltransferase involved in cell wall biosynthesis
VRYALVTPARDEFENLQRLAAAVLAQEHAPAYWVIVDDGSEDGTRALAERLAAEHEGIIPVGTESASGELSAGRREGRDLLAFRHGIRALPEPVDVVVKVDADLAFAPDYFARLIGAFADDPTLAIAGGACYEREDGEWRRRRIGPTAVWGASRAYRWECLDSVMTLAPHVGWDGMDEVKAQLAGYRTGTLLDLPFEHHRPEGGRETARVRAHKLSGRAAWYMGYRPTYLLLRALYRARRDRAALGLVWGYLEGAATRAPRTPERDVVAFMRSRQRLSVTLRGGATPL